MVDAERFRGRIGIPRAMLHIEFGGVIERFLRATGIDVLLSPPTDREIFRAGKRVVLDELCYPIKLFAGHVAWLSNAGVDRILIPVVVGHENNKVFPCHPQIRLADMVRSLGLVDAGRILSPAFRFDAEGLTEEGFRRLADELGIPSDVGGHALAAEKTRVLEPCWDPGRSDALTLAVVGHPYVLDDAWANHGVIDRLKRLGCRVLREPCGRPTGYAPEGTGLHFSLAARTMTLAQTWDPSPEIDGIVFLLPFNCGPDGDIARHLTMTVDTPMITLVLDELQSPAGIITRLEAFIDLLMHRRARRAEVAA